MIYERSSLVADPKGGQTAHFACSQKADDGTLISMLTFSESLGPYGNEAMNERIS